MLAAYNVTVGLGVTDKAEAQNTRFDLAWVRLFSAFPGRGSHGTHPLFFQTALESGGALSKEDVLALATVNLEVLMGIETDPTEGDLVATSGGDLLEFSKVVAVISPRRGTVDIL